MKYDSDNNSVFVSVITVCYNSGKTIQKTLESVLNQTYLNYEYIIIDGNSNDETLGIIENYKGIFKDRLTVISEPDKGIYDAMNKGIRMAKGKLIGLVNSNDYYEQDALEKIVKAYRGNKMEIVYGMQREFSQDGRLQNIIFRSHEFLETQMICHPTCFVSKDTYEKIGYFDLQYKYSSDYDFLLRAFRSKEVEFTPMYEIISNFLLGGVSGNVAAYLETFRIWRKYGYITAKRYYLITWRTILKKWIR